MSNKEYRPTLAQLRTFVTIAEKKHFGTAAQALGISQPSLSQALIALETGLGIQLVERSTRKVIITPAGEDLLPYAQNTLDAAEAFIIRSRGATGTLTGTFTIGMIPTAAPYLLTTLLDVVANKFPDLEPRIVEGQTTQLMSQLRDGQIDVALIATPSDSNGIIEIPLYTEKFVAVLPDNHPLAGNHNLSLADLKEMNLLLLEDGHCLRDQVLNLCHIADVNPSNSQAALTRATSLTTIIQLVIADMGATLVPETAVKSECSRQGVAISTFADNVSAEREMGLAYRSSSSRTAEFAEFGTAVVEAFERVRAESPLQKASTCQ